MEFDHTVVILPHLRMQIPPCMSVKELAVVPWKNSQLLQVKFHATRTLTFPKRGSRGARDVVQGRLENDIAENPP